MNNKEMARLKSQIKIFHEIKPHDNGWVKSTWSLHHWEDKDIENGYILLYLTSTRVYKYIRAKSWFPLPSVATVRKAVASGSWRLDPDINLPNPVEYQPQSQAKLKAKKSMGAQCIFWSFFVRLIF
jgi:hypothetical protein